MDDSAASIARDIAAIGRISAVPSLLRIVCDNTGMRFAAVARVTEGTWIACAVEDHIDFGLQPGGHLDVHTTLCKEARATRQPVVFDHASADPVYATHHTPRLYNIESYISVPIVRPDGAYFGNLCAIDPRPNRVSDAKTISMFQSFAELIGRQLDVEERQEETETALLDARAAAELREQFIAVLGHDLRNPLAAVSAIADLLARRQEGDVVRYGERLRSSTRRMSRLIDDVMDFARGRLGSGIGLRLAPVPDLATALHDVVAELQTAHPDSRIIERYELAGEIVCDLGRVQQLVSNLLANAVDYGGRSDPVSVVARRDAHTLTIAVSNGGAGIPATHLDKIFEPFWRPAESAPGGGLGLGLHICSQIVRAHGGTLQVTSSPDAGTTFTATLPIRPTV
ncbi:MAG: GAF domain-containing sensor histidine kinase [Rhizobacter sp.]